MHLHLAPGALFPHLLNHALTLRRRGIPPLFTQHLPFARWQLLKPTEILANRRPLVRRQRLKLLPPIAQYPALIGWQRLPSLKPLLSLPTLLR